MKYVIVRGIGAGRLYWTGSCFVACPQRQAMKLDDRESALSLALVLSTARTRVVRLVRIEGRCSVCGENLRRDGDAWVIDTKAHKGQTKTHMRCLPRLECDHGTEGCAGWGEKHWCNDEIR